MSLPSILNTIIKKKYKEIAERESLLPLPEVILRAKECEPTRGFARQLEQVAYHKAAIIAEIKKASPSKGVICQHFQPVDIAVSYEHAGACCLSILTDKHFFQGDDLFLKQARAACALPVLRKDFLVDPYQIYESRMIGADCILLIASCLTDQQLQDFSNIAHDLTMDVLVEVHDEQELERALPLEGTLLGINNRNLHTFDVSLDNTFSLLPKIPKGRTVVTESGIHTTDDVDAMFKKNVHHFLVGEAFMRQKSPGDGLKALFSRYL